MVNFLLLMLVPVGLAIIGHLVFNKRITWKEVGVQVGVLAAFVGICLMVAYWQDTTDVEIWNGQVTGRTRTEVSCRHSYPCNCHETCYGSGSSRSCSTTCDTCYVHTYDVDWDVQANIGSVSIDTIDSQGLIMPPRWAASFKGEPFSQAHSYANYIRANPDSVLTGGKGDVERWKAYIPAYPSNIWDYYRANHVLNMGVPAIDIHTWQWLINEANKTLGPAKQVNIVVLFVKTTNTSYVQALKTAWLGGKKNDAIIVIGSEDGHKIEFAEVVSWAVHADYRDNLRDDIMAIGTLDRRDEIVKAIYDETKARFVRMQMKDFQYLMRSFQPSTTAMWVIFLLAAVASIGLSVATYEVDFFEEETHDDESIGDRWRSRFIGSSPVVLGLHQFQQRREPLRDADQSEVQRQPERLRQRVEEGTGSGTGARHAGRRTPKHLRPNYEGPRER